MPRDGRRRAPVIKDVASLAGVSVPTVSRYLNKTSPVSAEKTQRIARAIDLLGYRPSPIARALVKESLRSIAVFTGDTTLFGPVMTISGIELAAARAGYLISITALETVERGDVSATIDLALDQNPAGAIVLKFDDVGEDAAKLMDPSLPSVLIAGRPDAARAQISLCEDEGGYTMTKHLLELGHRTVHHVSVPQSASGASSRAAGWRRALREAGAPIPEPIEATWDPASGREVGRELAKRDDVTAVFTGNDEVAMGVIRGLEDAGKRVPEDVSVAGFDGHPLANLYRPAITTYVQDFVRSGQLAWQMLEEQIEDAPAPRLERLHGRFRQGESTGSARWPRRVDASCVQH